MIEYIVMSGVVVNDDASSVRRLLDGEVSTDGVTMVYGEPTTGKTTLALTLLVDTVVETGGDVLFIDAEGVSMNRFEQIIRARETGDYGVRDVLDRVRMREVTTYSEQQEALRDAVETGDSVELVVLDSLTARYRLRQAESESMDESHDVFTSLRDQLLALTGLVRKYSVPVVVTNQVTTHPSTDTVQPVGGIRLATWVEQAFELSEIGKTRILSEVNTSTLRDINREQVEIMNQGLEIV